MKPHFFSLLIAGIIGLLPLHAQIPATTAKMNAFVSGLMSKMTLEEKIGQLNLLTPGGGVATGAVVSADVETKISKGQVGGLFGVIGVEKIRKAQQLAVSRSRLKIPLLFGSDVIHGYKTTFPIPLGLSCSWDMALIEHSARLAGIEASADGLCWVYSPMVDIARDPRWGRVAEGSGEDVYLGSKIAAAMVRGYQGDDLAANNTVMACVKHFALYGAAEAGRDYNTTDMSRIKMYEYYLPPYKAAIDAGAGSVMTSFNEIDGIPATANKWLMTDLLRKQWGFKGFVVTDYTAINEMMAHGMGNLQTVSALALNAGVDMDMVGEGYLTTLPLSLQQHKVTQRQIDDACRRILEAKYKLGLFEDPYRYCDDNRAGQEILSADKKKAARELGARSCVLLKNSQQVLPLKKSGTIALIGPLANNKNNMLGTWAVNGDPQAAVPILEGIKSAVGNSAKILFAKGANISDDSVFAKKVNVFGERIDIDPASAEQLRAEAVATANKADVIVAVVGEASEMSGEAASRSDIGLPGSQQQLLRALAQTGKPLVVVLMSGRPLTLTTENDLATALLEVWFPGIEAGNAVADLLFGHYNPSGKLTMSFPRNVGQIPIYYNHKNTGRPQGDGPTEKFHSNYLDVANDPLFPFGYGLSYTSFKYDHLKLDKATVGLKDKMDVSFTLTNTGAYAGEEIVQLYLRDKEATIARPVKELKDFKKIRLEPGENKTIHFTVDKEKLSYFNSNLQWMADPGMFEIMIGSSSADIRLKSEFELR
ncbi:beta-glucosidase BglX [Chitinophaga sp. RAB17]|uniref:beta-glucosidase BglX n=1 Tax=Chitinophaga sp. RAB17 TaxID=3233049 RepID=UPI003F8DE57A